MAEKILIDTGRITQFFPFLIPVAATLIENTYSFKARESIKGEAIPNGVMCILDGSVDIFRTTSKTEEEKVGSSGAGEMIGEGYIFGKVENRITPRTRTPATIAFITDEALDDLKNNHNELYQDFLYWIIQMTNKRLIDTDYELALIYGLGELFHAVIHSSDGLLRIAKRIKDLMGFTSICVVETHPTMPDQSYVVYDTKSETNRPSYEPVNISSEQLYEVISASSTGIQSMQEEAFAYILGIKTAGQRKGYLVISAIDAEAFSHSARRILDHIAPLVGAMILRRQELEEKKALELRRSFT